jgi:hypothetical protein
MSKLNVYAEHIQRHKHLCLMFMPNTFNGIETSKLNGYAEVNQRDNHHIQVEWLCRKQSTA